MIYNADPARVDLFAIEGDEIDIRFYINATTPAVAMYKFYAAVNGAPADGSPFSMTAAHLQVRRKDGLLIKDWISGVSPSDIVLSLGQVHLSDSAGFLESGVFDYDLEVDGLRIMTGMWSVKKQITL